MPSIIYSAKPYTYGPLLAFSDAFELIDQLAREISLSEGRINELRENVEEKTRFIAKYVEKLAELEGAIKVSINLAVMEEFYYS